MSEISTELRTPISEERSKILEELFNNENNSHRKGKEIKTFLIEKENGFDYRDGDHSDVLAIFRRISNFRNRRLATHTSCCKCLKPKEPERQGETSKTSLKDSISGELSQPSSPKLGETIKPEKLNTKSDNQFVGELNDDEYNYNSEDMSNGYDTSKLSRSPKLKLEKVLDPPFLSVEYVVILIFESHSSNLFILENKTELKILLRNWVEVVKISNGTQKILEF